MSCDAISPSCFTSATRRARKQHRCGECGQPIAVGDRYQYVSGIWDGSPDSHRTCIRCAAVRDWLQAQPEACGCVPLGELTDTLDEYAEWFGHAKWTGDPAVVGWAMGLVVGLRHRRVDAEAEWRAKRREGGVMQVKCRRVTIHAKRPEYAHHGDAGLDLFSDETTTQVIGPGERRTLPTGWVFEIPAGYVGLVQPRSGLASKDGVVAATGVIDSGYRGEIKVTLYNHGAVPLMVSRGTKIAQMVIVPVTVVELVEADELSDTARGANGFGSTGQ
jgi:dUTP pyrophosphatase